MTNAIRSQLFPTCAKCLCIPQKAYPREIEDMFYEHPKVKMVAAIGVPREDEPSNEFVKAFIGLKDEVKATPDEFIEWARGRWRAIRDSKKSNSGTHYR